MADLKIHVCSHMRQVVYADSAWWHVQPNGVMGGSECVAGVYATPVVVGGQPVSNLVPKDEPENLREWGDHWKAPERFTGQHPESSWSREARLRERAD